MDSVERRLLNYVSRFDSPQDPYHIEYTVFRLLHKMPVPRRSLKEAEQVLIATVCDGDLEPEVRKLASDLLESFPKGVRKDANRQRAR
jgi:hypothetical protein